MTSPDTIAGRFEIERRISGPRFFGIDRQTRHRVHVTYLTSSRSSIEQLRARFDYDVPDVARCVAIAPLDGWPRSAAIVEELPSASDLAEAVVPLDQRPALSARLARLVRGAHGRGIVLAGLHPQLLFFDGDQSRPIAMPRALGFSETFPDGPSIGGFGEYVLDPRLGPFADPATLVASLATPESDVYMLGLVITWIFTRKHPFASGYERDHDWLSAMSEGTRDPFHGPPALDRLLGRMLLPDPAQRAPIDEIVGELEAMLRA